jgi:hypothetical protein
MNDQNKKWRQLFLFSAGLAIGASFCMKWMESDFVSQGHKFTIIGLELFYSKQQVFDFLSGVDPTVKKLLNFHLAFDFAFMAGIYPAIGALCMMCRRKVRSFRWKSLFIILAVLQLLAWALDIAENLFLLKWVNDPSLINNFSMYHVVVALKWIFALAGIICSLPFIWKRNKPA